MIKFICYLFPAILAVAITEYIDKDRFALRKWIYYYVLYVLSINFIIAGILTSIFAGGEVFLHYDDFNNILIVKYLGISMFLAILLPILFKFIKKNFNFEFKIEDIKTKDKNKDKRKND